jgi:RimJ/RimL family protein N-acetyltransferase
MTRPVAGRMPMTVLETDRLVLRHLAVDDAPFVLRLVNEPSWLENIGDRGVRTLEDAEQYIRTGPLEMYARLGFGLFLVELEDGGIPIGLCGFLERSHLPQVDIGFAFVPEHWGKGYAFEAASAAMSWGRSTCGFTRILAITAPHNHASSRLLKKLGFDLEGRTSLPPDTEALDLYASSANR